VLAEDGITYAIVESIAVFPFEVRKELLGIAVSLIGVGGGLEEGIAAQSAAFFHILTSHYSHPDLAMVCGQFLRDLAASPIIHLNFLTLPHLQTLHQLTFSETFETSSDSFETYKLLLLSDSPFVRSFR
jgi:hypothetical protein